MTRNILFIHVVDVTVVVDNVLLMVKYGYLH